MRETLKRELQPAALGKSRFTFYVSRRKARRFIFQNAVSLIPPVLVDSVSRRTGGSARRCGVLALVALAAAA